MWKRESKKQLIFTKWKNDYPLKKQKNDASLRTFGKVFWWEVEWWFLSFRNIWKEQEKEVKISADDISEKSLKLRGTEMSEFEAKL